MDYVVDVLKRHELVAASQEIEKEKTSDNKIEVKEAVV